jgi:opacity protein-like surface antigen
MASMCSLAQTTAEGWSTTFDGAQIGADAMETWSRGLERFNTARAKYDPAQFCDVDYRELISDPLGTVAGIYRHFGMMLTDEAQKCMADIHAESQTGARAPKHRYSLADYGLTVETVKERFAGL